MANYPFNVLDKLKQCKEVRRDEWRALCPAHDDHTPSLAIKDNNGVLLLKCWAGCSIDAICSALSIEKTALFDSDLADTPDRPRLNLREVYTGLSHEFLILSLFFSDMAKGANNGELERERIAWERINYALTRLELAHHPRPVAMLSQAWDRRIAGKQSFLSLPKDEQRLTTANTIARQCMALHYVYERLSKNEASGGDIDRELFAWSLINGAMRHIATLF